MLSALLLFFFVSVASDSIFNVAAALNSDLKDAAASNQATDFIIEVGEMEKVTIPSFLPAANFKRKAAK